MDIAERIVVLDGHYGEDGNGGMLLVAEKLVEHLRVSLSSHPFFTPGNYQMNSPVLMVCDYTGQPVYDENTGKDKTAVHARIEALKVSFTDVLWNDLQSIPHYCAETELSTILTTELSEALNELIKNNYDNGFNVYPYMLIVQADADTVRFFVSYGRLEGPFYG